jgi:isopentenyl phosphate kinase
MTNNLIFLKLGGSLITDKTRPRTVRPDTLKRLCEEIASARERDPNLLLVLGHGSGSFGHVAAKKYKTRDGLPPSRPFPDGGRGQFSPLRGELEGGEYWFGFSEVWHEARALNIHVMDTLRAAGVPAQALPASASVISKDGKVAVWNVAPIQRALLNGIVPVVYGDVIFDEVRGGTILSTEDLFMHLAGELRPQRILLAGLEDGIYADFPVRKQKVERITPQSIHELSASIGASVGTDVTGGMDSKVRQMLALVQENSSLEVLLYSGEIARATESALLGEKIGTLITSK